MAITAMTGPLVTYGAGTAPTDYNSQRGPSVLDQCYLLGDPRATVAYQPGQSATAAVAGWLSSNVLCVDAVPSTLSTTNIAAAYTGASPVPLVTVSGAGITVGVSINRIDTNAIVSGLLAIDNAPPRLSYGSDGAIQAWNPANGLARCVVLTSTTATTNAGLTITVNGYDVYGQPMTQTLAGPAGTASVTTAKAFKYIASVTFTGGTATSLSVGTSDVYGFSLRCDNWGYAEIIWNNVIITANTGHTLPDATNPATAATGDVRGTYLLQATPSNGVRRLIVFQSVSAANISSIMGLLGVTQV